MGYAMRQQDLLRMAERVLTAARERGVQIVTAESCTGGQIASLLTDIVSLSRQFDRGFVTYTEEAKTEVLAVPATTLAQYGPVSEEVAKLMAAGALAASKAEVALAVTGYTGKAGPHDEAGLIYLATLDIHGRTAIRECNFGTVHRQRGKQLSSMAGLELLEAGVRAFSGAPQ